MYPRLLQKKVAPINYEALERETEACEKQVILFEKRLTEMANTRHRMREEQIHFIHKKIWLEDWKRLANLKSKYDRKLALIYNSGDINFGFVEEATVSDFQNELHGDFIEFLKVVISPITSLSTNIKEWLRHYCSESLTGDKKVVRDLIDCMVITINNVHKRLNANIVNFKLPDFCDAIHQKYLKSPENVPLPKMGIPTDAWNWECSDSDLQANLLAEYIHLDAQFISRYNNWTQKIRELCKLKLNGWNEDENFKFECLWEAYRNSTECNRNVYCVDFLARFFQNHSKIDIQERQKAADECSILKLRLADVVHSWERCRRQLGDDIRLIMSEYARWTKKAKEEASLVKNQQDLCQRLAQEVRRCRQERTEQAEREEEVRQSKLAEERKVQEKRMIKENSLRQSTKIRLQEYWNAKIQTQLTQKAEKENEWKELNAKLTSQNQKLGQQLLRKEKNRIGEIIEGRIQKDNTFSRVMEEREARLEAIRNLVRPSISCDTIRAFSNTESWRRKTEKVIPTQLDQKNEAINKFYLMERHRLTTFGDSQLQQDRRTRLSTALHEAGLLDSEYARNLLANVPLERPPRKDLIHSNIFKEGQTLTLCRPSIANCEYNNS